MHTHAGANSLDNVGIFDQMIDVFECIVSLGGLCQVAYQIEKQFGFRVAGPFDWLVTPLDSVGKILDDDGCKFGLAIRVEFDGQTAVCAHYGVAYQHDYLRDDERKVIIDASAMEMSRSKMLHKYSRFIDLMSLRPRTLFARLGGHHSPPYPSPYMVDDKELTESDLNDLWFVIASKFPGLDFELAFLWFDEFTKVSINAALLDPRVRLHPLHCLNKVWEGDQAAWSPVFDTFRFNIKNPEFFARQFVGALHREHLHG